MPGNSWKQRTLSIFVNFSSSNMQNMTLVDNNILEIFNAFIVEERFKPIWIMLNEIFKKVMSKVNSKK